MKFNIGQRVHYNFLEAIVLLTLIVACITFFKPLIATIIGAVFGGLRVLFVIGYSLGPNKWGIGAIPGTILVLLSSLFSFFSVIYAYF
jgi:uncharacterized membrane protein